MSKYDGIPDDPSGWYTVMPDPSRDAYTTVSNQQMADALKRAYWDGVYREYGSALYEPWPVANEMHFGFLPPLACVWVPGLMHWHAPLCTSRINATLHCCKALGHTGVHESAPIDTRKHTICWK